MNPGEGSPDSSDDIRPEYSLDYSRAQRNRFVADANASGQVAGVIPFSIGRYLIEVRNEPSYSINSADNLRTYVNEYVFDRGYCPNSKHGITCCETETLVGSALIAASGGGTGIHQHSIALLPDRCFVAVGPELVCLSLPKLELLWHRQVDQATCFRVHFAPDRARLIIHGELEISCWTIDGARLWSVGGADIFTGHFEVHADHVAAEDFYGNRYRISFDGEVLFNG